MLSLTQPAAVKEVHRKYFAAGADIVETNTFSSTTIAMADYGMENWYMRLIMNRQSWQKKRQQNLQKKNLINLGL